MRFGLREKMYLGYGVTMAACLGVLAFGLFAAFKKNAEFERVYVSTVKGAAQLSTVQNALWQLRFGVSQFMTADPAGQEKISGEEAKWNGQIEEHLGAFEKGKLTAEEMAALKELKANFARYKEARPRWFELYRAGLKEEAAEWRAKTIFPFGAAMVKSVAKQVELQQKTADERLQHAVTARRSTTIITLALAAAVLIFGASYGWVLSRRFCLPIKENLEILRRISGGDLTQRFRRHSNDEMGDLSDALNILVIRINDMLSQISQGSDSLSAASRHLQGTAQRILAEVNEVASQSCAVATASEQMAATSGDIAFNCQSVAESSQKATHTALSGKGVVETTVEVMSRIASEVQGSAGTVAKLGARSVEIGEIISTIEDIADQTNLLALNAAIEAARAGDLGRGFAVVADEVRALAERTARATKEISGMIKSIQKETNEAVTSMEQGVREVDRGSAEARKSGEALQVILDKVNEVAMQANQIATAAEEQTATTAEISSNIQQITSVINRTTQGAQDTAGASNELAQLADGLKGLVNQYRLG